MAVDQKVVDVTEDKMAGALLRMCVGIQQQIKLPWASLPEADQARQIEVMGGIVRAAVRDACNIIASEHKLTVRMQVDSVTFKDGVKASLSCSKSAAGVFDLAQAEGGSVTVLLTDYERFQQGTEDVKPTPDQQQLDLTTTESVPEVVERDGRTLVILDGMPMLGAPNPFPDQDAAEKWLAEWHAKRKAGGDEGKPAEGGDPVDGGGC